MVHDSAGVQQTQRDHDPPPIEYPQSPSYAQNAHNTADNEAAQTVVLPTANVTVLDYDYAPVTLRALLDTGELPIRDQL